MNKKDQVSAPILIEEIKTALPSHPTSPSEYAHYMNMNKISVIDCSLAEMVHFAHFT